MEEKTFLHIARIARIRLRDEELSEFMKQIEEIFSLLERVKTISFDGEYELESKNPLRKDRVNPFEGDITEVFPKKRKRYLEVPKNL